MPSFRIPAGAPVRLDRFVAQQLRGGSRRAARDLLAAGGIRVNGRAARKGDLLQPGDRVEVDDPAPRALAPQPDLPLAVLRVDVAWLAVDKPADMPAVGLHPRDRGTLANALLARFPELAAASPDPLEAGLVHRLDTATSGVVLAARTAAAWRALRTQFGAGAVRKEYLALVAGALRRPGTVRLPIAHRPRRPREMCACPDPQRARAWHARPAVTRYRPLQLLRGHTLLAVEIPTGVRHQIRVHLAAIGHPILGDPLYAAAPAAGVRLMLHAARVACHDPLRGDPVEIECQPPPDFLAQMRALE